MRFSNLLKYNRELKQLSQEDLAKILNVSKENIIKWEKGTTYPSITTLIIISDHLEISLDKMIKDDDSLRNIIINSDKQKNNNDWGSRGRTIGDFLADYWWTIFPVGAFLLFIIKAIF
ncbi:transcriptional regulator with XRE-family HTH domain [Staphylococcus hominis]